jgi:hypothetical protein
MTMSTTTDAAFAVAVAVDEKQWIESSDSYNLSGVVFVDRVYTERVISCTVNRCK